MSFYLKKKDNTLAGQPTQTRFDPKRFNPILNPFIWPSLNNNIMYYKLCS
ncbi:hypothetical protein Hanom_Chr02g00156771 [Helianthus anomalus]